MSKLEGSFAAKILSALGQAIVVIDLDGCITYWNSAAEEMFGWRPDEVLGRDARSMMRADPEAEADSAIAKRLARGDKVTEDYWMVRRDGTKFPVLTTLTPIFEGEEFVAVAASATDMTERRQAEEATRKLSLIVESSTDAIIGTDAVGIITSWNSGAERIYGYAAGEVVGTSVVRLVPPGFPRNFANIFERWLAGERVEIEGYPGRRKDGTVASVNVTISPIRNIEGKIIGSASIARDVTERKRLQEEAEEDRRRLAEAQDVARLGSFELDPDGTLAWSQAYRKLLGVGADEPASVELFLSRVDPRDRDEASIRVSQAYARNDGSFSGTFRIIDVNHEERLLQIRTRGIRDESGELEKIIGTALDVTELHRAERARRQAEEMFRLGFERGAVATAILDLAGYVTRVNPMMCEFLKRPAPEMVGRVADEFLHEDDREKLSARDQPEQRDRSPFECRFWRPDGTLAWGLLSRNIVRRDDGTPVYVYAQVQDITERKIAEQALEHLALHDPLTDLPNRLLLEDRLEVAMLRARRYDRRIAVVFGDIDRFKLVNDSLGHSDGDQLLVELARRLEKAAQGSDTVGRFGGDEFMMICEDVGDMESAESIGRRMSSLFDRPFSVGDSDLYATVSCGVVLPCPDDTPGTVMRDGDAAMYRAKELGRARTELFDKTMLHRAARLLDLESALRQAVENGDLRVAYQPIVDLTSRKPVGIEALLRWQHPTRGDVTPSEFIPVAEQAGLINPIGRFVLEEAVSQIATWREGLPGAEALRVSINLSSQQLSQDLVALCENLLASGAAAGSFGFEITESVLMADVESAINVLRRLRELEIPVSIDDFGTGYSSLEYLERLPVHSLKIDRTFIAGLGRLTDDRDPSIVRAVIALAKALGLGSCAEGVETEEQLAALIDVGCDRGQGFLWAKAMNPGDFEAWFQTTSL